MRRRVMSAAVLLVAVPLSGCLQEGPSAPDGLAGKVGLVEVHVEDETHRLDRAWANETGLVEASLDALVGTHSVRDRSIEPDEIPAAFNDSDYVHLAFRRSTPVHLPLLRKGETRVIEDVYLVLGATEVDGNLALNGGLSGVFASSYDEDRIRRLAGETLERTQPDQAGAPAWSLKPHVR